MGAAARRIEALELELIVAQRAMLRRPAERGSADRKLALRLERELDREESRIAG